MDIKLVPLTADDREQFILDNQQAFKYGAQEEFGMRDDRMEEGEEVISRKTIERCLDDNQAEAYRIMHNEDVVGGMILKIEQGANWKYCLSSLMLTARGLVRLHGRQLKSFTPKSVCGKP